jgi:hypothetical protein
MAAPRLKEAWTEMRDGVMQNDAAAGSFGA